MGAPVGNTNATKNKPWAEALARVNVQSDGAKMRALAEKVWELALAGDQHAIKEIAERHDGKAPQGLVVEGGDPTKPVMFGWMQPPKSY